MKDMKCPICAVTTEEENPRFCETCGWEFKVYLSDVGEAERAAYAERVRIARENWEKLQEYWGRKKSRRTEEKKVRKWWRIVHLHVRITVKIGPFTIRIGT